MNAALKGKTVLLVDDDSDVRQVYADSLQLCGAMVVEASGVSAALAELSLQSFDAVITDVEMPVLSGVDLIREVVKRYPANAGHHCGIWKCLSL